MDEILVEIMKIGRTVVSETPKDRSQFEKTCWFIYGAFLFTTSVVNFYGYGFSLGFQSLLVFAWFCIAQMLISQLYQSRKNNAEILGKWSESLVDYGESVVKNKKVRRELEEKENLINAKNEQIAKVTEELEFFKAKIKSKKK